VAELLDAVDVVVGVRAVCLLADRACDPADPCRAHVRWTEIQGRVHEPLATTSLAGLLGGGQASDDA
jgi:hypothetical protein